MKKQKIIFLVFALCILAVPLYVMIQSEDILDNGHRHKLQLRGRDPFDPFRGKYIRLNVEDMVPCESCKSGDEVFILLTTDESGFSHFSQAVQEKPDHSDYFMAEVLDVYEGQVRIKTDNITKYFINEDKAQPAEKILWDYEANMPDQVYLAVRVLDGEIRIEDIFIQETPLLEFIEQTSP